MTARSQLIRAPRVQSGRDATRGVAVAVELRRVLRQARRGDRLDEPVGVVVDEDVGARLDGVDPLRGRPQRHARDAVPVRLLLQAARVGDDHARLRGERGQVEVAERLGEEDVRPERRQRGARARVRREDDRLLEPVQAVDDAREPLRAHVRLAVDGREQVAAGLDAEALERPRAVARERREPEAGVGHHVADDLDRGRRRLRARACRASARPGRAGGRRCGRPRSGSAPRASRGRRCAGRPRRGRAGRRLRRPRGRRRASSSCRRRRAPRPAAPPRARQRCPAPSRPGRRCAGRAGTSARAGRAPRRRPPTARGRSAGRCGGRPPRSRPRAARPTAVPT